MSSSSSNSGIGSIIGKYFENKSPSSFKQPIDDIKE